MLSDRPDSTPQQRVRPRRGIMLVISSPSGAGKTTLCSRIISEVPGVELSISATTREPRPNERDGSDYHFRSVEQFQDMIERDEFLEWARVFKNFYGTPRSEVEARLVQGMDVVFDVDWQGARALKTIRPGDVVSIFILPPSLAQLKQRLEGRPGADPKSVQSRLDGAGQDILRWGEYDYAIVNDNLDTAFNEIRSILITERNKRVRASLGIMVDNLLKDAHVATKTQSGSATSGS
ncbi:MAG TPA: guanylate kinase [Hyphomonadaceae bacterium]|nr:guanylate kinase [Hyphomonadaceae bacterium]HPN06213.1 guanylate kinase [Hyphomonadaceae bacterium]